MQDESDTREAYVQSIEIEILKKIKIFCRITLLRCLKNLICSIVQWSSTKFVQVVTLGYKMAPPQRVLASTHRNRWKIFRNLLQYHLHQMLEIRYVALPSGTLSNLFKSRYEYARTHGFEA